MVDWNAAAMTLKKEGVVEISLWGWPRLNFCLIIRDALKRRGCANISLSILDASLFDKKVRVTLKPKAVEKKKARR